MKNNPIPEWATKPGTTVVLEPGGYGRRKFHEVKITRVTKASVFVMGPSGHERRFVPSGWRDDADRMWEYGQNNGWSNRAYIYNPSCEDIVKAMEKARTQDLRDAVAKAARSLADEMTKDGRTGEHIPSAIAELRAALDTYEAAAK